MFSTHANLTATAGTHNARRRGLAIFASLSIAIGCLGLSACGDSSGGSSSPKANSANAHTATSTTTAQAPTTDPSTKTPASPASQKEVAAIKALVGCLRRHGIPLPEPEASGHVDTQGIDLNSPRYKAALVACLHERQRELQAGG
jgi:pyruvate/2-oxoglutarate dehydrogenase complex dihydrolipoamide acyltransferase (E2) component